MPAVIWILDLFSDIKHPYVGKYLIECGILRMMCSISLVIDVVSSVRLVPFIYGTFISFS